MAEIVAKYKIEVDDAVKSLNKVAEATKKTEEATKKATQVASDGFLKGSDGAKRFQMEISRTPKTLSELELKLTRLKELLRDDTKIGTDGFRKVTAEINKTQAAITKANGGLTTMKGTAKGVGSSFVSMGRQILAALGFIGVIFAIINAVKSLVSINKDFEFQMAKVKAITGASNDEFQKLTQNAIDLGATTKYTATQVASLQEEFAKLGFTTKEILNATEATLNLAQATSSDLGNAAQVAGNVLRGFGIDAGETARVTDVMAKSFSSSGLNMSTFAEAMKYVAPIARAANIDLETTTALLGKLADTGLSGSRAGTGLKNIMSKLSDENSKLSKEIGFTVRNSDDLIRAFSVLRDKNIDLTEATELTDERSKAAFITLINGADGVKQLADELDNATGSAKAMADIMRDTLEGDLDAVTSAWENLMLTIGNTDSFRTSSQLWALLLRDISKGIKKANGTFVEVVKGTEEVGAAAGRSILKNMDLAFGTSESKAKFLLQNIQSITAQLNKEGLSLINLKENGATEGQIKMQIEFIEDLRKKVGLLVPVWKELTDAQDANAETQSQINNVFFLQKAIKELTDTQKEQGTSVERVKQITDELIPLKEQLAVLLGKETEAMKAAREEREKAIKAIEDEAKALRKSLKAKIDAMHDSEEKAKAEALESIEFRFALEKLYTTQSISEADGRSDALLQIEHDRLEAILKARREFGMETIEQEQALADLQAGILDGQNKSGDGAGISRGEVNGNKWWFDGMSDAQLGEFEDSLAITEQYVGAISGLFSNLAALQSQLAQEELKNLDEQLEAGAISREEYDIRRRQILTQQAEDQKAFAVFDSAINGALAIVNAFAEGGPILAAIVGLGVAAQIAAIVAAPIPQFAQGVIGLKGKGTETSDEIPAMLSLNESVMTGAETREYNAELWAMRNGTFDKLMKEKYSVPKIDASLFSGWGDMGKSAKLNGLMATLKDHNIIAALDRSRQSQTNGFKYLAKELTHNKRQNSRLGW